MSLVHALHHRSAYRLTAQGEVTAVETTTGIKQGCKLAPSLFSLLTGKLSKELVEVFGEDRVCAFLTGYADDQDCVVVVKAKLWGRQGDVVDTTAVYSKYSDRYGDRDGEFAPEADGEDDVGTWERSAHLPAHLRGGASFSYLWQR